MRQERNIEKISAELLEPHQEDNLEEQEEIPDDMTENEPDDVVNSEGTMVERMVESVTQKSDDVRRTRSGRVVTKPSRFMAVTKMSSKNWKETVCDDAIKAELSQLFKELCALRVVRKAAINEKLRY